MDAYDFAEQLMDMDNAICDELCIPGRPSGPVRQTYFEYWQEQLEKAGIAPEDITGKVIAILSDNNFHSTVDALDIYTGATTMDEQMRLEAEFWQ